MVSVGMLPQEAPGYEPQAADSASLMQTYLNLVDRARQHPDVEQATPVLSFVYPGAMGNGTSSFIAEGDLWLIRLYLSNFCLIPISLKPMASSLARGV